MDIVYSKTGFKRSFKRFLVYKNKYDTEFGRANSIKKPLRLKFPYTQLEFLTLHSPNQI